MGEWSWWSLTIEVTMLGGIHHHARHRTHHVRGCSPRGHHSAHHGWPLGAFCLFGGSCLGTARRRVELQVRKTAPRPRGDGPTHYRLFVTTIRCSSHPRGCPHPPRITWEKATALRSGGDGPGSASAPFVVGVCSPLAPGPQRSEPPWPAAPCTRGDGPDVQRAGVNAQICSPLARGWPREAARHDADGAVLPAPAGMDPWRT